MDEIQISVVRCLETFGRQGQRRIRCSVWQIYAECLELQVTPTKNRLDQRGVNSIKVGVQTGVKKDGSPAMQDVDMTFVNEKNLYKVIMRSDKPQAEPFQDWVCGDVLPTLRKTGSYLITTDQVSRKDLALNDY